MQNIFYRKKIAFVLLAASLLTFSCTKRKSTQVPAAKADENTINITTTFYPLYVILLNITDGIDGVSLSVLAPPDTGCLHDYQLTTGDMKKIENCNILVANGSGMEDFLEKIMETKKTSLVIATEGFELEDNNSHVWVSPSGAIHETQRIVEGLVHLDPVHAAKYAINGNNYISKLQNLRNEMHSQLDGFAGKNIVTFHEAFPYFASEFNLNIASVIEREPGEIPGTRELAEQIETIKALISGGTDIVLFAEPQYSSSAAEIIAKETGLKVFELDPCVTENPDSESEKDSYIDAMKKNAEVLKAALAK